jgi:hypothetical protein
LNISKIEIVLKRRLKDEYSWGRKQNNYWDNRTNFIYRISNYDKLLETIETKFSGTLKKENIKNYVINRWYNFWSAKAIEEIFCSLPGVIATKNNKNRFVDFEIRGIKFDHKTTIFPSGYPGDLNSALNNKKDLIKWLYSNQSQQNRRHYRNRLFIVLYSFTGEHWKLKAEITWLQELIINYVKNFREEKLEILNFSKNYKTKSDIIWGIK